MARKIIDLTTQHPGWIGDQFPVAFAKVNDNFEELYARGGANMLINCGLPINQRGFAGGALAAGAYGYDRWKAGAGGCSVTINATTGVFTHAGGPLQQVVETPHMAWGQPLTVSVEDPSGPVAVSVGGTTGSIPAGTGRVGVTLTPSGSGDMVLQLTAAGVTYSRPKLERGNVATAFVPLQPQAELALCQRYYEKSYAVGVAPGTATRSGCHVSSALTGYLLSAPLVRFAVTKRTGPAVTLFNTQNGAAGQLSENGGDGLHTYNKPAAVDSVGTGSFEVFVSNGTASPGNIERVQWTADAEL
ncbi:hypothetical protein D7Y52_06005 [Stenotrophomonas maltophilia]|uniref:hypothetical protein n=1 Tax=Stenotrophomonas maltophilia TaxID=40324 RepID=UPI0015DDD09A|nr:hypothetical protein [Stenotrophomonas maltophilia]MBA0348413.1 hypothetical protein [Stenotrophomonas maltophilia]